MSTMLERRLKRRTGKPVEPASRFASAVRWLLLAALAAAAAWSTGLWR
jgi:hypothetical protein